MTHYETPGVSVAVIHNGRLEWARGFGVREWGAPDPVTDETLFQAGSISKPVFALAVMSLVQSGKLDLDADVNHYLTTWKIPANGDGQPRVTLRQLLSHTAGLTVDGFPGYLRSAPLPSLTQILNGQPPANSPPVRVNQVPGAQCSYSGGGFTVAQKLMEDVLGKPFPDLMRELILDPLGMKRSTYEQPLPEELSATTATAHPFHYRQVEGRWHVYPEMAAAGLWTTPSDLARVVVEVQCAANGRTGRIVSAATASQMLTPQIEDHTGICFELHGKGRTSRFGHSGWNEGFVALWNAYRFLGLGAVIMVNSNQGAPMILEIERAIAREYDWPDYLPAGP
jgi:CubicO group peptidase (beta-lactamase class C family)